MEIKPGNGGKPLTSHKPAIDRYETAVADPTDQNFLNFMQFLGKSGKFYVGATLGVGAPSYGESCFRP